MTGVHIAQRVRLTREGEALRTVRQREDGSLSHVGLVIDFTDDRDVWCVLWDGHETHEQWNQEFLAPVRGEPDRRTFIESSPAFRDPATPSRAERLVGPWSRPEPWIFEFELRHPNQPTPGRQQITHVAPPAVPAPQPDPPVNPFRRRILR